KLIGHNGFSRPVGDLVSRPRYWRGGAPCPPSRFRVCTVVVCCAPCAISCAVCWAALWLGIRTPTLPFTLPGNWPVSPPARGVCTLPRLLPTPRSATSFEEVGCPVGSLNLHIQI